MATRPTPQPPLRPSTPSPRLNGPVGEVSLLELVVAVLEQGRLMLALPAACLALVMLWTLLEPRTYTVTSAFAPQSTNGISAAMGLAARFGISLPQADPTQSPQFYATLVSTDDVLRQVVSTPYTVAGDSTARTLMEFLGADGGTEGERREDAIRLLRRKIEVTLQQETGLVQVEVTTWWPDLSLQVATRLLEVLNTYNINLRRSRAGADRAFMQERVTEAAGELRQAEEELQGFLQRNREYTASPQLTFEHDRLQREVNIRQDVFTSLVQALDNARLEEARSTPLLTIVNPPQLPVEPDRRHFLVKAAVAVLVGLLFAGALALGRYGLRLAEDSNPEVTDRLRHLVAAARGRVSRRGRESPG